MSFATNPKKSQTIYVCRDCGLQFPTFFTAAQLAFHYARHARRAVEPKDAMEHFVLMQVTK